MGVCVYHWAFGQFSCLCFPSCPTSAGITDVHLCTRSSTGHWAHCQAFRARTFTLLELGSSNKASAFSALIIVGIFSHTKLFLFYFLMWRPANFTCLLWWPKSCLQFNTHTHIILIGGSVLGTVNQKNSGSTLWILWCFEPIVPFKILKQESACLEKCAFVPHE